MSIVAVNVFVLISGWFGIRGSIKSFSNFAFQCLYFSTFIFIIYYLCGLSEITPKRLLEIIYITPIHYWFIKAYIALYILSPILNKYLELAKKKDLEILLLSFYLFQTIYGWSKSAEFIQQGYSAFSFIGLYLLSSYARKYLVKDARYGLMSFVICAIVNSILYYVLNANGHGPEIYAYINPFVIIGALGLLLYFNSLNIPYSKAINWIAKSAFAVYLLHGSVFLNKDLTFVPLVNWIYENSDGIFCILHMFIFIVLIYAVSIIIDQPRRIIWRLILNKLFIKR